MPDELNILSEVEKKVKTRMMQGEFMKLAQVFATVIDRLQWNLMKRIDARLEQVRGKDGKDSTIPGPQGAVGPPGRSIVGPPGPRGETGPVGRSIFGGRGETGAPGKDGSPDTPIEIRDKLASIEEEEDKLPIDAIRDLRKELDELKRHRDTGTGAIAIQRGAVKAHDLSDSLDGVTKTFSLPVFWRVISVHLSSFPTILRPTTDYTTDGSLFKITFTSEINASTSLAAGQSLIIVYAEP